MSEKKSKRMTAKRALEIISREMECYCAHYDEEADKQCKNAPTLTVRNSKFDTSAHWCAEHSPGKQHYADDVDPFEGGIALEFVRNALAKAGAK